MRVALKPHPDSRSSAVTGLEVELLVARPGILQLDYIVTGSIDELLLPAPAEPERRDDLWRHTCFEAFLGLGDREAYLELNFSPSTQWAAYRFASYRAGMADAADIEDPRIEADKSPGCYRLRVSIDIGKLPASCRLGLSVIVEEKDGRKSCWALAHPPGKADFHHSDGFALQLPATSP